jgi:hypothetical protein
LKTLEKEAPRIIAFQSAQELNGLFIVGDSVCSQVAKDGGLMAAILELICAYYVFDVTYPRPFTNLRAMYRNMLLRNLQKASTSASATNSSASS